MKKLLERTIGPSISVHIVLAEGLPFVLTDANQLEMALLNLTINARDAMANGGVVTISASSHAAPPVDLGLPEGQYLTLSVADPGCGMNAETLARARDPSSPPKAWAEERDWAFLWCMDWASSQADALSSKSRSEKAPPPRSGCRRSEAV